MIYVLLLFFSGTWTSIYLLRYHYRYGVGERHLLSATFPGCHGQDVLPRCVPRQIDLV